jgi:hypothetical protein
MKNTFFKEESETEKLYFDKLVMRLPFGFDKGLKMTMRNTFAITRGYSYYAVCMGQD